MFAEIISGTFRLGGEPSNQFNQVRVNDYNGQPEVIDNGSIPVVAPVSSDGSSITTVDFLGFSGSGVSFYWGSGAPLTRVNGSNSSDSIYIPSGNNRIYSANGDDQVITGEGNDSIWGGFGNDTIEAGGGNDLIYGQQGNDQIDGGDGYDTLVFTGNRDDYQIDIADGAYRITHLTPGGRDGIDTFGNVEALRFADQTIDADQFLFV